MGITSSKTINKKIKINDFNLLTIPEDYELIKIGTFKVNLKNTVNLENKVNEIVSYLFSDHKNKKLDILCLQGIKDYSSLEYLIKIIKKCLLKKKSKNQFYFSSEINIIKSDDKSSSSNSVNYIHIENIIELQQRRKIISKKSERSRRIKIQNLIISRFPIVNTIYSEIDDNTDIDDVLGAKTVIGANISIYGNIISIYNTCLSKDIETAHIINKQVREKEIETIFRTIEENKKNIYHELKDYVRTNIHILIGNFNFLEMNGEDLNSEYIDFIKNNHCVDLYRYFCSNKEIKNPQKRVDYIFLILSKKIYDKNSLFYEGYFS